VNGDHVVRSLRRRDSSTSAVPREGEFTVLLEAVGRKVYFGGLVSSSLPSYGDFCRGGRWYYRFRQNLRVRDWGLQR
jgi:hypothetical protein